MVCKGWWNRPFKVQEPGCTNHGFQHRHQETIIPYKDKNKRFLRQTASLKRLPSSRVCDHPLQIPLEKYGGTCTLPRDEVELVSGGSAVSSRFVIGHPKRAIPSRHCKLWGTALSDPIHTAWGHGAAATMAPSPFFSSCHPLPPFPFHVGFKTAQENAGEVWAHAAADSKVLALLLPGVRPGAGTGLQVVSPRCRLSTKPGLPTPVGPLGFFQRGNF